MRSDDNPLFIGFTIKGQIKRSFAAGNVGYAISERAPKRHHFSWNCPFFSKACTWGGVDGGFIDFFFFNSQFLSASFSHFFVIVTWIHSLVPLERESPGSCRTGRLGKLYTCGFFSPDIVVFLCLLNTKLSLQITGIWLFSRSEKELCFETCSRNHEVEKDVGKSSIVSQFS